MEWESEGERAAIRSVPGTREMRSCPLSWQPSPERCVRRVSGCQPIACDEGGDEGEGGGLDKLDELDEPELLEVLDELLDALGLKLEVLPT